MRVLSAPRLFLAYRLPPIPVTAFDVRQHCVWLVCGGDPTRTPPSSTAPLWPLRHRIEILARLDRPPDRLAGRSVNSLTSTMCAWGPAARPATVASDGVQMVYAFELRLTFQLRFQLFSMYYARALQPLSLKIGRASFESYMNESSSSST